METVLREVEFDNWVLRLNLEGYGGFWIKGYKHRATTRKLTLDEAIEPGTILEDVVAKKLKDLEAVIESKPQLSGLTREIVGFFPNQHLQIDIPIREMGSRNYSLNQIKDFFSRYKFHQNSERSSAARVFTRKWLDFLIQNQDGLKRFVRSSKDTSRNRTHVLSIENIQAYLKQQSTFRNPQELRKLNHILRILEEGHPLETRLTKDKTSKVSIPGPLPEEFVKGHYGEYAEKVIAPEGSYVNISDKLRDVLEYRKQVSQAVAHFVGLFDKEVTQGLESQEMKVISQNFTRVRKLIDEVVFRNKQLGTSKTDQIVEGLSEKLFEARRSIDKKSKQLEVFANPLGGCEVRPDFQLKRADIWFYEDIREEITYVRMPEVEDIKGLGWWVDDLENFEFGTEHAQVSISSSAGVRNDKVLYRRVKDLYRVGVTKIGKYDIIDEIGVCALLIESDRDDFKEGEFGVACSFNTGYDLIVAREFGPFEIGSRGRAPQKVVSIPFFERIRVPGRKVLDPLKWARTQYDFLPNQKLVMVARQVDAEEGLNFSEDSLGKIINYRHGRQLERGRRTNSWDHLDEDTIQILEKFHKKQFDKIEDKLAAAGQLLDFYAAEDLEMLLELMLSDRFNKGLEDTVFMSKLFRVDPFLLMHDPKRIDRFMSREYFDQFGTWQSELMPRFKNLVDLEQRAKSSFTREKNKLLPTPKNRGFFEDVHKVYIPLGRLFRDEIRTFMSDHQDLISQFYTYIDSNKEDQTRQYYLTKYEDALFDWLYKDYMFFCFTRKKFEEVRTNLHLDEVDDLEGRLHGLTEIMQKHAIDMSDVWLLTRLKESRVDQSSIEEVLKEQPLFGDLKLSTKEIQRLLNKWLKKHYQSRRLKAAYDRTPEDLDRKFAQVFSDLETYLQKANLDLLHVQNNFLYVRGDQNQLTKDQSPFILVDELDRVFITKHTSSSKRNYDESDKKIYYPKHGYWEGIKEKEDPSYQLTTFEMELYGGFLKDAFAGDKDSAVWMFYEAIEKLREQSLTNEELVWYSSSAGRYYAYEDGKKISFQDWNLNEVQFDEGAGEYYYILIGETGEEIPVLLEMDDHRKRFYFIETTKTRKENYLGDSIPEEKKTKIYVMPVSDVNPDWKMYTKRISDRAEILMEPLVDVQFAKRLIRTALKPNFVETPDALRKSLASKILRKNP